MKRSTSRILTTHTGSLPRSPELQELLRDREEFDGNQFQAGVRKRGFDGSFKPVSGTQWGR